MEEDIGEKQQYLFSEIIEGGYNPDDFQEYLDQAHPEWGVDLNLWPLSQLKKVTQQFKNQTNNKNSQQTESEQPPQTIENEKVQSASEIESPMKSNKDGLAYAEKHEFMSSTVTCQKALTNNLSKSDPKVVIEKYEKKQGGVFEKSYYVFQVKTLGLNYIAERRYSDFQWLRQTLGVLHPGLPVPPISRKGGIKKRSDEKHLMKRMYLLQKFLNKLLSIPEFKADQIVQKFLSIESQKSFEKYKKDFKKVKSPTLDKMKTISGSIDLVLSQETNTLISRSQKYLSITQPEVKKIYKDFKGAATMLENCSTFLKSIGQNCHKLNLNYRQFRKECYFGLNQQNLFSLLDEMTSKYAELLNEQAKTFRKEIYSLVKYESFYMINMVESLQKLASLQQSFIEDKIALKKKKEKLYDEGNMSKWGLTEKLNAHPPKQQAFNIMLPKETKQVLKTREKYALYNSQIHQELLRHFKQNDEYLYNYFIEMVKMETDISSRGIMVWADVQTKAKGLTTKAL